jgi:hypothetical protein
MSKFVMPSYVVFLDTNTLFSPKPEQIISKSAEKILKQCQEIASVGFFTPSVVPSELAYQQSRKAIAASENMRKNQMTISSAVGINLQAPPSPEDCCAQAKRVVAEALNASNIQIYEIPIGSISWEQVIDDACWRNSTFEEPPDETPEWEKGFRDRLVLEASLEGLQENGTDCHMVFISGDNKLREAFEDRSRTIGITTSIFSHPSELLSEIQLMTRSYSEGFAKQVISSVPVHFYKAGSDDCIFNKFSLKEQIIKEYGDDAKKPNYLALFGRQSKSPRSTAFAALGAYNSSAPQPNGLLGQNIGVWEQSSGLRIKIGATEFHPTKEGSEFFWITKIELACMLSCSSSSLVASFARKEDWVKIVNVEIHWKCKIDFDGNISDSIVERIEKSIVSPFIEADWQTKVKFNLPLFPAILLSEENQTNAMEDRVVGED